MKRLAVLFFVVISLALGTAAAGTGPRVMLMQASPVIVNGVGFDRDAAVVVTVTIGDRQLTKKARTNANGAFSVRWAVSLAGGACIERAVSAATAHRRAAYKSMPSAVGCGAQRVTP